MTETAAKKDIQKLQRAIVDALEDVKAQEIQVFDTEHLSSLFERVIIASGTSNRQTKALAASVRDKVRQAGFGKPRIEGEDNGEWIIVDCAQAVVHIMPPTIRSSYNLAEILGGTPVRMKFGAPKPVVAAGQKAHIQSSGARTAAAKTTAAKTAKTAKTQAPSVAKAKPALKAPSAARKPAAKTPVKTAAKSAAKSAPQASSSTRKPTVKTVGKPAAKAATKSAPPSAAKKAPARKAVQATSRRKSD